MKRCLLAVATFALGATSVHAQEINDQCTPGAAQDACQKTIDLFHYFAPQLGTIIAGGNATLGQGGTLGGFPHFRVSVRANVMSGSLPQVADITPSTTLARQDTYETKSQIIGLPQLDAAVGVFKGIPLGITNVGGVDLLATFAYLPSFDGDDISIKSSGAQLGVGIRIGIIQEGLLFPGVSLTYLHRGLPTVDIRAVVDQDSLFVNDVKIRTSAIRLVASKSLLMFGIAAGVGRDNYNSSASTSVFIASPQTEAGPVVAKQKLGRTNAFVDLSMNLPFVKFIAEVGHVSGGKVETYNSFSGKPADASRTYGSVGVRFGL